MRICVDMDGTICKNKIGEQQYFDVEPIDGAVDTLNLLKIQGYYIVIHTARGMRTYENNQGRIIAAHAENLINWLKKWNIPYDEVMFGKPHVDYFIDDKGYRFDNWQNTYKFLMEQEKKDV